MAEPKWLQDMNPEEYLKEDFEATGHSRYTVDGLEKNDPDGWTRQLPRLMLLKAMTTLSWTQIC